ncbi:hypothetical protein RHORCCE3_2495 [Rickettsia hoogstraalii str. RCCE3]|nr:hypothetical protein RHORCCE3_2495 [Rickettsia hoogstraalii str. RCCE3]
MLSIFPKKVKVIADGVLINGTFRYWFSENKHVAADKTYLLTYKRGANHLFYLLVLRKKRQISNEKFTVRVTDISILLA